MDYKIDITDKMRKKVLEDFFNGKTRKQIVKRVGLTEHYVDAIIHEYQSNIYTDINEFHIGATIKVMHDGKECDIKIVKIKGRYIETSIGVYQAGMLAVMRDAAYNKNGEKEVKNDSKAIPSADQSP